MDPGFTALPLERLADAALHRAEALGVAYADFRLQRIRSQSLFAKDRDLERMVDSDTAGFGVRVIHDGAWGFAATADLSPESAVATAERAVEVARTFRPLNSEPVELAGEAAYQNTFVSDYQVDPFDVDGSDKVAFLLSLNDRMLAGGKVQHADSHAMAVKENKYFANLEGSRITQQRVRINGEIKATRIYPDSGEFDTMASATPPAGRGWEYLTDICDLDARAEEIPDLLEEKMASPSVERGRYDLVIHPTNLWLTIHESIGHSTELDRALGYEANFAGTSFATIDKLNQLRVGSEVMNVTGDRDAPFGLATIGYDDEGVAAQRWHIIKDGVLVGYQLNRQMAARQGFGRSNGCAYADSPAHVPLQRMPNVSLNPSPQDITLEDLIGGVERGIYIVGNKSWSIDQQRYNFQFTGQRFFKIEGGKLGGQLKDVAYQATTTDFWGSMEAVGGESTYVFCGTFNCGKGQPGQVAPAGHGAPAALFRDVNVLNTSEEGR
jgi:TldD protein